MTKIIEKINNSIKFLVKGGTTLSVIKQIDDDQILCNYHYMLSPHKHWKLTELTFTQYNSQFFESIEGAIKYINESAESMKNAVNVWRKQNNTRKYQDILFCEINFNQILLVHRIRYETYVTRIFKNGSSETYPSKLYKTFESSKDTIEMNIYQILLEGIEEIQREYKNAKEIEQLLVDTMIKNY